MGSRFILVAALGLLAVTPSLATADAIFRVSGGTAASTIEGFEDCQTFDQDAGSVTSSSTAVLDDISSFVRCATSDTLATAFADIGGIAAGPALRLNISTSASGGTNSPFPVSLSSAGAQLTASEIDNFNITGSGRFELFYSLEATLIAQDCITSHADLSATVSFGSIQVTQLQVATCAGGPSGPTVTVFDQRSMLLDLMAGDSLPFGATLAGSAGTTAIHPNFSSTQANVLAGNTLHFFLTPLTPGASYLTDSGLDYARSTPAPIPEPSSMLLLGLGLVGLMTHRKGCWLWGTPRGD